jgi:MFS transporter, FHS family, L-fucose permease
VDIKPALLTEGARLMILTENVTAETVSRSDETLSTNRRAMTIATTLFFMWGFLTCLNDILIPHLKAIFELTYAQVMLVQFAFFSAYFAFAVPAGKLVEWRGYKQSMVIGLLIMAAGAVMFLPASAIPSFNVFLAALILLAAGITVLQVAANPYVANLGPQRTASSRLNLAQAFNSLGTTIAPFFGSVLILSTVPLAAASLHSLPTALLQQYRMQQASSVRLPYLGIAVALLALAAMLALVQLPALNYTQDFRPAGLDDGSTKDSIWNHPHLLFGAIGIFVYVGAEVSIGSFLINYLELPTIGNLTEKTAALYVSLYWFGAMVGRFIGSAVLQRVRTSLALAAAAAIASSLVVLSVLSHGHVAMFSVIAVGLFNSIMFPSIFTLGIADLRQLTSRGSSLLVAAIVGGAVLPLLQGQLADRIGVQHALIIPAVCYVYIFAFGLFMSKKRLDVS